MVRGLALRSLCSLRLPAMVEYISDPLKASLVDANSYVRKTGVMAILKMWHLWPQAVEEGAMVDTLYNMLQDGDAQVWFVIVTPRGMCSMGLVVGLYGFCLQGEGGGGGCLGRLLAPSLVTSRHRVHGTRALTLR